MPSGALQVGSCGLSLCPCCSWSPSSLSGHRDFLGFPVLSQPWREPLPPGSFQWRMVFRNHGLFLGVLSAFQVFLLSGPLIGSEPRMKCVCVCTHMAGFIPLVCVCTREHACASLFPFCVLLSSTVWNLALIVLHKWTCYMNPPRMEPISHCCCYPGLCGFTRFGLQWPSLEHQGDCSPADEPPVTPGLDCLPAWVPSLHSQVWLLISFKLSSLLQRSFW